MPGYNEVERQYRVLTDAHPSYVPYIVMLDRTGQELANSGTKLSEPIAIPSGAAQNRVAFMRLLCANAKPPMIRKDVAALRNALEN